MTTILEALKTLYAALGGTAADVADITTISGLILAIAELKESEASQDSAENSVVPDNTSDPETSDPEITNP